MLLSFNHPLPNHVGGSLEFGPDGYLYLSVGDGGQFEDPNNNGQNNRHFLGKILRLDVRQGNPYDVPEDNPFVGDTAYLPEIWATGLRNPWRMTFDRLTGDMWIGDVGEKMREEIDLMPAGEGGYNFGWSCSEGSLGNFHPCPDTLAETPPLYEYKHNSHPSCSGCITGGYVYRGTQWGALWGRYFFADFCTGNIWSLTRKDNSIQVDSPGVFSPFDFVSFAEDRSGELYLAGYFSNKFYHIGSSDCRPVAQILGPGLTRVCEGDPIDVTFRAYGGQASGMAFQWQKNGENMAGAINPVLTAQTPGVYRLQVYNPQNQCIALSDSVVIQSVSGALVTLNVQTFPGSVVEGVLVEHDTTFSIVLAAANGCDSTVQYVVKVLSGIQEPDFGQILDFEIQPNPARGQVNLHFNLRSAAAGLRVWVSDAEGRPVYEKSFSQRASGAQQISLQAENWPPGLYTVRVFTEQATAVGRLLRL